MRRLPEYSIPLLRMIMGGDAIHSWYNAFHDPGARLFRIAQNQDNAVMIWAIGLFGAAIIIDVIINDLTPEKISVGRWVIGIQWSKAFEHRHWLFVMLAVSYAIHPALSNATGNQVEGEAFFYWSAMKSLVLAVFDMRSRTRSPNWQRAFS